MKAKWHEPTPDLLATVKAWFEPLMAMAPTVCDAVGDVVVFHAGDLPIALDFPRREVREWRGEDHGFWFKVQRELVETVVAERANDWSNSLFLSCRFSAWRGGQYNEYVYNFFKSLDVERMRRTEAEALRKLDPDHAAMAERGHAHRRLDRATRLPAPRGRPQRVRRDRGRRVGLHAARLALRPAHRPLPQRRRSPLRVRRATARRRLTPSHRT